MGMFRTVHASLPCTRCGRVRPTDVQVKTGDDGMEIYSAGGTLPVDDDLLRVTIRPATVDRFCDACRTAHRRDEREAQHDALAGLIEQGRLRLSVGSSGVWLTADEARRLGRPPSADAMSTPSSIGTVNGLWGYVVEWDGATLSPREYGPWSEYVDRVRRAIDERLRAAGWADGGSVRRSDLRVAVAADRRIDVILVDA